MSTGQGQQSSEAATSLWHLTRPRRQRLSCFVGKPASAIVRGRGSRMDSPPAWPAPLGSSCSPPCLSSLPLSGHAAAEASGLRGLDARPACLYSKGFPLVPCPDAGTQATTCILCYSKWGAKPARTQLPQHPISPAAVQNWRKKAQNSLKF